MTNREWLQKMALIDFLNLFMQNCDQCILCVLGFAAHTERCDKFDDPDQSINETCYKCICSWLNEKH